MKGNVKQQVGHLFAQVNSLNNSKHTARESFNSEYDGKATMANFAENHGVYSHETAEAYKTVWRECLQFAKDNYGIKNIEKISGEVMQSYLESKIAETKNYNTISKINSAIVKMGVALDRYEQKYHNSEAKFLKIYKAAIENAKTAHKSELFRPEQARAYEDTKAIRDNMSNEVHKIACELIQETGMRINELAVIHKNQLKGNLLDYRSKGGQFNLRPISQELADKLKEHFDKYGSFIIDKDAFRRDVKQASEKTGQKYSGVHGLRWSAAQDLYTQLIADGIRDFEARSMVSQFLTHHRIDITNHYLKK